MVPIIQPNSQEFRHHPNGGSDTLVAFNHGKRRKVEGLDTIQAFPPKRRTGKVVNDPGKVANRAARSENAWFFPPNFAIP